MASCMHLSFFARTDVQASFYFGWAYDGMIPNSSDWQGGEDSSSSAESVLLYGRKKYDLRWLESAKRWCSSRRHPKRKTSKTSG